MQNPTFFLRMAAAMLFAAAIPTTGAGLAQQAGAQETMPAFHSIAALPLDAAGPVIRAHTEPLKPFTVAGERGVLVGEQDGSFEAWLLPAKLLSHLTIEADIDGYTVPIDVNRQSAAIEVRPDRTVITYSHIGFTVRQIMFSPDGAAAGTGPMVLFEFDCLHPTEFVLRFTPELRWMWPERSEGTPGVEWVRDGGFYVLHGDYPDFAGAVTIPGAKPGVLAPYQERPQVHPVELRLHIDPKHDAGRLFPLLMAMGSTTATATDDALGAKLAQLNDGIAASYATHAAAYRRLLAQSTVIETPDAALNEAFRWAEVSIEQLKAKAQPSGETALVAGYYESGDSARPGFGWFFGRDALYTLFAVNGFGDFALTREELEFLMQRQRADGKIMHEYSQTAPEVDWKAFLYMYAAADATPLFLLAVADYVRTSGDTAFLAAHREAVEKAWAFETDPAHDTDHDGVYDNSQGTGWVESWPSGMPHQEVYLALLDEQASAAMAEMEGWLKDAGKARAAQERADKLAGTIEAEYYDGAKGCYAFSRNLDGSQDRTRTVYPAVAWWSGKPVLTHGDECLRQFAAATLNTDWGLRDVANDEAFYDGMSYHQGSVWPLFTGWGALAEYRGGQPLAGYQMLMENAGLTRAQDLGAVTELLSGDFFVPFGRSTSHQLWSSAMVITPALRGLFGLAVDAGAGTVTVDPQLPARWEHAAVRHVRVGAETVDVLFARAGGELTVTLQGASGVKLRSTSAGARQLGESKVAIALKPVAVDLAYRAPLPGNRTAAARVLSERYEAGRLTLTLEGQAGSEMRLPLVENAAGLKLTAQGAELHRGAGDAGWLLVRFAEGSGWKTATVTLSW